MVGDLFSDPGFMPHIHCYLGKNSLVWTMFFTDLLIGLAYVSISLMLWALVRKIRIEFSLVILCFGLFIGACGATHFLDVWTLWHPNYWVAATVKIVTALASVGTGFYLYRLRHLIVKTALAGKRLEIERNQKIVLAEQDLRDVLERTTDGFFQINSEWKVTFVNPVTQKFDPELSGNASLSS